MKLDSQSHFVVDYLNSTALRCRGVVSGLASRLVGELSGGRDEWEVWMDEQEEFDLKKSS